MKKTKVDCLIIGSGVGGMCTAARLAAEGMKVCVIERLSRIGGRFSTREINGCKMTTGAIMVPYGERSAFQQAFDMIKAPFNVRQSKGGYCYRLKHGDLEVPPEGGGGLLSMFEFAMQDLPAAKKLAGEFRNAAVDEPSYDISFRDWLGRYTDNKELHSMMQGFCAAFVGTSSNEVPAGEYFRFLKAMGRGNKYGIAVNGNIELMESLEAAVAKKDTAVRRETACKKILIEQGTARGAVVEHKGAEEIIEADFVVSNMGPKRTVKLAGEADFKGSYLTALNANPHETPVFHICIISEEPLSEFHGIYNFGNTKHLIFMECPTLTCPELSPDGRHVTTTFSVPASSESPVGHNVRKETIKEIIREIKDNFPAFDKMEKSVIMCAHHGEWPSMRRWPGYPMPVITPVKNLYNVGDGCMPAGTVGIEACALSARTAAEAIIKNK